MRERRKVVRFPTHRPVEVTEPLVNPRGNAHFNRRRPDGPVCPDCGARWEPICSTRTCQGSRVPRAVIRSEKTDVGTRRYDVRLLEAKEVGRRGTTPATSRGSADERIAA